MKNKLFVTLMITGLFFWGGTSAQAITYGFDSISENTTNQSITQNLIGEKQFWVDVTDYGSNYGSNLVLFTFFNNGPIASVIAAVYFDDKGSYNRNSNPLGNPLLRDIAAFKVGEGVNVKFAVGANPGNLPSGKSINQHFTTTDNLSAGPKSDKGTGGLGVDPGEAVGIIFGLKSGKTFENVIVAMNAGELHLGIHGIALGAYGGSESFVNVSTPVFTSVPVPASALLLGTGLMGLVMLRRTRRS